MNKQKSGLYKFSKQANDRLNGKINDLLMEIYNVVEEERKRLNNNDPNFIIINTQALTLSIIDVIITKINKGNIEYASMVSEEIEKREDKKPIYGG